MMVKQGLKNFFISLKYFFTPLGSMFLGMMIGLSVLIPGVFASVNTLVVGVGQLSASVSLDFNNLFGEIWGQVMSLDWSDPVSAFGTALTSEWIDNVLTGTLQTILGTDFETFSTQIVIIISEFTVSVIIYLVIFFIFWAIGFAVGFLIVRAQIRGRIAKRSVFKSVLAAIVNAVLATVYVAAAAVLSAMWSWSVIISAVLMVILTGVTALLEAYIIHGRGKVTLKQVVNAKNVGLYALTGVIIYAIAIAISVLVFLINGLMGLFVGLTLIMIAATVVGLNAESYVKSVAEGVPAAKSSEKSAENTSEKPVEDASGKSAENTFERPAEKTADAPAETLADTPAAKSGTEN